MANPIDALNKRKASLKQRFEEYEARHMEKCKPLQDEVTGIDDMLDVYNKRRSVTPNPDSTVAVIQN